MRNETLNTKASRRLAGTTRKSDADAVARGECGEAARREMESLLRQALAEHGEAALRSTRRDSAVHEAGHCAVYHAEGEKLRSAAIWPVDGTGWSGITHAGGRWQVNPYTAPQDDLSRARITIAGWAAEVLEQGDDVAAASSLDEIVLFQQIVGAAAHKLGDDPSRLCAEQMGLVAATLAENWTAVQNIANALERRKRLNGAQLKAMLKARGGKDTRAAPAHYRLTP